MSSPIRRTEKYIEFTNEEKMVSKRITNGGDYRKLLEEELKKGSMQREPKGVAFSSAALEIESFLCAFGVTESKTRKKQFTLKTQWQ